jgi:hypothetical protein
LKHNVRHKYPGKCTLRHFSGSILAGQSISAGKINGIKDLAAILNELCHENSFKNKDLRRPLKVMG